MMATGKTLAAACTLAILALTACGASPTERFYTLTAEASAPVAGTSTLAIAVGPVNVPAAVDQPQMVAQIGPNQVALHEYHRWAGPLKGEIARVIAANLAQELGTPRVWSWPQTTFPSPDLQVLVDVQRFDSVLGEAVIVEALWTIRPAGGGVVATGRSFVRQATAGDGFEALAAAHSRALARVSRDIAAAIRAR
jgi:uncharacterized lipoprotein YmbA